MKLWSLKILMLLPAFAIVSCATSFSPDEMRKGLEPWIGQSAPMLLRNWGSPSSVVDIPNEGGRIYSFFYSGSTSTVSTYNPYSKVVNSHSNTPTCQIDFFTNSKGIINDYRWAGNCVLKKNIIKNENEDKQQNSSDKKLSSGDKIFLDKMLADGKITQEQYDLFFNKTSKQGLVNDSNNWKATDQVEVGAGEDDVYIQDMFEN